MRLNRFTFATLTLAAAVPAGAAPSGLLWGDWHVERDSASARRGAAPLPMREALQDLQLDFEVYCEMGCRGGVQLAAERPGEKGMVVSLDDIDRGAYSVDAKTGVRVALTDAPNPFQGGAGIPDRLGGRQSRRVPPSPPALPARPAVGVPSATGWHRVQIRLTQGVLGIRFDDRSLRSYGFAVPADVGQVRPCFLPDARKTIRYRAVVVKDLLRSGIALAQVGKGFEVLHLDDLFLSEAIASGDFDRDGHEDLVSGPKIYFGPDFRRTARIYPVRPQGPAAYQNSVLSFVHDWTGDGWPDVLELGLPREGAILFVNPGEASRYWDHFEVVPSVASEAAALADIDGDGKPELVFARPAKGRTLEMGYAAPTGNATAPWTFNPIAAPGDWGTHGMGVGDIDGDGRMDIVGGRGWWSPPGKAGAEWSFHPQPFGFGAQIPVTDIDGDGIPDTVGIENAHGWGLAWFKGERGEQPAFTRRSILGSPTHHDLPWLFSEAHALAVADMDGDGLADVITGKRWWGHLQSELDPDPDGAPVLYWFRQVRESGQVRFEPQLIHDRSGAGTQIVVRDLTGDNRPDVAVATRRGVFLFRATAELSQSREGKK